MYAVGIIKSALVLWLCGQINYCLLLETCVYSITYNYSFALHWPPAAAVIESRPSLAHWRFLQNGCGVGPGGGTTGAGGGGGGGSGGVGGRGSIGPGLTSLCSSISESSDSTSVGNIDICG